MDSGAVKQRTVNEATAQAADIWQKVYGLLRDRLGATAFQRWLAPLPVDLTPAPGIGVRLNVPTRFMRDWITQHYADQMLTLWQQSGGQGSIEYVVTGALRAETSRPETAPEASAPQSALPAAVARPDHTPTNPGASFTDDFAAALDPRFTFDNFVVGKTNELAFAAARRVAETATPSFNPLFLYGGCGLGKTHLMHAIAWHIRKNAPQRRVIYMSAEKFMYQFVRALRFKDTVAFKEQFRSVDVLMIDDVQFISGREHTQEEFFHTFNALVDQNRQVIVSADKSPQDLDKIEERLRSRLGWGLVADIHPTSYELRLSILHSKAAQASCAVPEKVLEFLAYKIASNVRELEGGLNRIVAHAQLVGREISLEMTQEVLADLLRASDRRITIDEIQKRVAEHY
ncbi:MAG: chromosomal replication initiator protein DnaA, partial [Hyphomicrobium sp.]